MARRRWGVVGLAVLLPAFGAWGQGAGEGAMPAEPPPPPAAPATWSAPLEMRPYPDGEAAERTAEHYLLLGEARGEGYDLPLRFILSLDVVPGYDPGSADAKAWLASLPPTEGRAALDGRCLSGICVIGGSLAPDGSSVSLTVTLEGPAPGGRYEVRRSSSGPAELSGSLAFTTLTTEIPGLGTLAEATTNAGRLATALRWQGYEISGWAAPEEAPDGDLREALAGWQQGDGKRPPTGLVFADDIAALEADAARQRTETGWAVVGGDAAGWSLGVPLKVLSKTSEKAGIRSWQSPDGRYALTLALGPAKESDAMDALFEQDTTETDQRNVPYYNRSGDDYLASYVEAKTVYHVMVHNRAEGFARAVFSYPDGDDDGAFFERLIDHGFTVSDGLSVKP